MWNKEKIFIYACRQTPELELQKAIESYRKGDTEHILKWLFENRIQQIQSGEFWEGDINDLQKQIAIQAKQYKMPIIIAFNGADKVTLSCAIIAIQQHNNLFIIEDMVSKYENDVIKLVEQYDPFYFSLDSIYKRRKQELALRK